jgi:8-oxo-dGTP pyrophosphatase MutT (NUDIX family)
VAKRTSRRRGTPTRTPVAKGAVNSNTLGSTQTPALIEAGLVRSGMDNSANMGPGRPLNPSQGYSGQPRSFDYPVGVNIATQSRSAWGRPSFSTLKAIIGAYDIARMCVNHKVDELRSMEPMFLPADGVKGDLDDAIDAARTALSFPDRELPFDSWLSKWMESCLKYDAGTLYRRRDKAGRVIGLEVVDGSTIGPFVDENGRRPRPPEPAYFQTVHGQVWEWYTSDDIIYTPFRPQDDSPYGLAPIESILLTANTDLRFQYWFLQSFTEGSLPAAFGEVPTDLTSPDQIREFQEYWDAVMEGDQAQQHKIKWVPAGTKFTAVRENTFDSNFPEYLMARTCAAFGVVPQDLGMVKDVNRANGETQTDIQFRVNTLPWVRFVEGILTRYLQRDLGLPVKIVLDTGRDKADRLDEAKAMQLYVDMGALSPDEVRSEVHGLPIDNQRPTPRFFNSKVGPIPLLAIEGIAGLTDSETYSPAQAQPVLDQPFVPAIGVLPMAGTTAHAQTVSAEDSAQTAERTQLVGADAAATVAAQDGAAVTKEATAGVTSATGITGSPMSGELVTLPQDDDDDEDDVDLVSVEQLRAELASFGRFTKARSKAGRWRDFTFAAVDAVHAHRLNDHGRAQVRKAAGELVAAGLAVRAADTGRVLMLQRAVDPEDPASGTWECPGGHIEDGETPLAAACREWQEETGVLLPVDCLTAGAPRTWLGSNGVYQGFVLDVASESLVNTTARGQVTNPDADPDGDVVEALAWTDPAHLPGWPALRPELAADLDVVMAALTPAAEVAKAGDRWAGHPARRVEAGLVPHHQDAISTALGRAVSEDDVRAAVAAYLAANRA